MSLAIHFCFIPAIFKISPSEQPVISKVSMSTITVVNDMILFPIPLFSLSSFDSFNFNRIKLFNKKLTFCNTQFNNIYLF